MAERSKALRSGRSLVLQAWVRIPLLTVEFCCMKPLYCCYGSNILSTDVLGCRRLEPRYSWRILILLLQPIKHDFSAR